MSFTKLVLKGTGRMSLHERFTQLKFDQKSQTTQAAARDTLRAPQPRTSHSASRSYEYSSTSMRSRTPDMPRYSASRRRSMSPATVQRRPPSVRNQSVPNRNPYSSKSSTLLAANRIKKKSVYLRLGVRPGGGPRMSSGIPVWAEPYSLKRNRFGRPMSRSNSTSSLNRWNSHSSLNSYDTPRYQNNRRYGGFRGGRGGRRNFSAYNRNWRFGRNRFGGGGRGRGRYRGRGRGRGRGRKPPPPNREQLDQELDTYMAGTRGILDKDLDTYMENKA